MVIDSSETGTCTHHNQLVSWEKGADMQRGCSDALEAGGLSRSFFNLRARRRTQLMKTHNAHHQACGTPSNARTLPPVAACDHDVRAAGPLCIRQYLCVVDRHLPPAHRGGRGVFACLARPKQGRVLRDMCATCNLMRATSARSLLECCAKRA